VGQSIEQRRCHLGIPKYARPFSKRQVGRDQYADPFIQLGQQVKQQGPSSLAERQIPQLIKHYRVHSRQTQREPTRLALRLLLLQRVDQIHRRVEPDLFAVLRQSRDAQRRGQVRFARPRPPNEYHVLRILRQRCRLRRTQCIFFSSAAASKRTLQRRNTSVHDYEK